MKAPPNRVVATLLPYVSYLSGLAATEFTKLTHVPISSTAAFATTATGVLAAGLVWLFNWGKHEANMLGLHVLGSEPVEPLP